MFIVSFFLKNISSGRSWLLDFQLVGVIRSERSGSAERAEMNHRLVDLDAKVQAIINEGAKRPEKAQSLVRVDRMDHRQMKTALHRASNVCSWQSATYSYN